MFIDTKMNVLIVDDYRTMPRIIRNPLKQIDFEHVEEATDGAEALAGPQAGNFGLVINDWNMEPIEAKVRELSAVHPMPARKGRPGEQTRPATAAWPQPSGPRLRENALGQDDIDKLPGDFN